MKAITLLFAITAIIPLTASGQEKHHPPRHDQHATASGHHFRIGTFISHTLIPGVNNRDAFFIPSWGLDIEYWPNHKWGIGLHNDIELETFVIIGPDEEELERSYPLVSTLDLLYRPFGGLVIIGGVGHEWVENDGFFILRLGMEYEIAITKHWDVFPTLFFDTSTNNRKYQALSLGIGFGYSF